MHEQADERARRMSDDYNQWQWLHYVYQTQFGGINIPINDIPLNISLFVNHTIKNSLDRLDPARWEIYKLQPANSMSTHPRSYCIILCKTIPFDYQNTETVLQS